MDSANATDFSDSKHYYVYGLVDPAEVPDGVDTSTIPVEELLSYVVYVGKGIGARALQHGIVAHQILQAAKENPEELKSYGPKLDLLIKREQEGRPVKAYKFIADLANEKDAYYAETFGIQMVNALRIGAGKEPLTNAVAGHGIAVEPMEGYVDRLNVEDLVVTDRSGDGTLVILVKANNDPIGDGIYQETSAGELPFDATPDQVRVMEDTGETTDDRPAWNVHAPWSDAVARDRARRYWSLGKDNVKEWINNPNSMPKYVAMLIETAGQSVIRRVWKIATNQPWEYYYENTSNQWGIPLGETVDDSPLLNKRPIIIKESEEQKVVQAMKGNASGWKLIRVADLD